VALACVLDNGARATAHGCDMPTATPLTCDNCEAELREGDPFCLKCGKITPNILAPGKLAIEISDVPSAQVRKQLVQEFKRWFYGIDPIAVENKLRGGPRILVAGIDEQSGNRLLEALKAMKVEGRLIRGPGRSFFQILWNPGLLIGVGLMIAAALAQGVTGFILFLLGAVSPFGWAFWKSGRQAPLLNGATINPDAVRWTDLASQYSEIIRRLDPQDADLLKSVIAMIVDLQRSLKSHSLASVAAGEERGDLYKTLGNSSVTAIDLCRRITSSQGEERDRLRRELDALIGFISRARDQFIKLDQEEIRPVEKLRQDLDRTIESIDRIVQDVRSPLGPERFTPSKTLS
jgi:hypothetical protein